MLAARLLLAVFIFQFIVALPQTNRAALAYKYYFILAKAMENQRAIGCFYGVKYDSEEYQYGTMWYCSDYIKDHREGLYDKAWEEMKENY